MSGDDLIRIGRSRSRICSRLIALDGETPRGLWGGRGLLTKPEEVDLRHFCTVDMGLFKVFGCGEAGWLGLYENVQTSEWIVVAGEAIRSPSEAGGIVLSSVDGVSLPPLDQLLSSPDSEVDTWMRKTRMVSFDQAVDTDAGLRYHEAFMAQCPLYHADPPFLQVGGWHVMWPESLDYYENGEQIQIWTFRDYEPWVEVWRRDGSFVAIPRVT